MNDEFHHSRSLSLPLSFSFALLDCWPTKSESYQITQLEIIPLISAFTNFTWVFMPMTITDTTIPKVCSFIHISYLMSPSSSIWRNLFRNAIGKPWYHLCQKQPTKDRHQNCLIGSKWILDEILFLYLPIQSKENLNGHDNKINWIDSVGWI